MYHLDWFKLRFELTRDYPNRIFDIGSILDAYEFEGKVTLDKDKSIHPRHYKDHFRELRWWEHRTIEQLLTIKYAKVVSSGNYYLIGDVVPVLEITYNNSKLVGGRHNIIFNLQGHYFISSQLQPATKKEYEEFNTKSR